MTPGRKVGIFLICIVILAACVFLLPVTDWVESGLHWIESHPTTSWLVFILLYILATILLIPGSILTLSAGFLFKLTTGVVLVSLSSVMGACLAFLIGRFLARDWITGKIAGIPRFNALDQAIRKQGFLIVFLTRLSPLFPFNLLNYGLGLTGVRFSHYLFASWIGMLPGTVMYVYIGSAAKSLAALLSGDIQNGTAAQILFIIGLLATLVLTVIITRLATKSLRVHLDDETGEG